MRAGEGGGAVVVGGGGVCPGGHGEVVVDAHVQHLIGGAPSDDGGQGVLR
jgi:hypothetical protein